MKSTLKILTGSSTAGAMGVMLMWWRTGSPYVGDIAGDAGPIGVLVLILFAAAGVPLAIVHAISLATRRGALRSIPLWLVLCASAVFGFAASAAGAGIITWTQAVNDKTGKLVVFSVGMVVIVIAYVLALRRWTFWCGARRVQYGGVT